MKIKLLILLILASIGATAQSWTSFGTGAIQRRIVGSDTTFRWVGSTAGTYVYGRSEFGYSKKFVKLNPSSPQSGGIDLTGDIATNSAGFFGRSNPSDVAFGVDLAIGDGDTGIKWVGDGEYDLTANNTPILKIKSPGGGGAGGVSLLITPTTDATPANILTWDATTKEVKKVAKTDLTIYSNIKDFGAIGDSTTNASASIQNAINASGTTFIPKGTYLINTTVLIPSNHTLLFEEGAIFKSSNGLNKHMIRNADTLGGNVNISIKGGNFNGNKAGQTDSLAVIYFANLRNSKIENATIYNGNGKTIDDGYNGALTFSNSHNIDVINTTSRNNTGTAFIIMASSYINVRGGNYSNNGCTGVGWYFSPYCSAVGVTATNNPTASGISANGLYSTVVGNYTSGNKYNINVGHTIPSQHYASYSTITGNTSVNGDYGINAQAGQVGLTISGNNLNGNGTNFVGSQSPLDFNYAYKGISIKNQNPNSNASINIGANFNSVPSNTHMIMQGGSAIRFTGEDGNADQGGYIFGGSNFIGLGSRLAGTNLDGISVSNGKVLSSSIKIQAGASLPTVRPNLEFTTLGSDPLLRNWAITNNDLHTGDFSIRKSVLKGGSPIDTGLTFLNIDTTGRTQLKKLYLEDVDYVTTKFNATTTNVNARNWSISTNSQDFGDFEIRQSSSSGGGTDFNQGVQRFYISRTGNGIFNGTLNVASNDITPTAVVRNGDIPFENYLASGTGASTTITIPHGLTGITAASKVIVQPLNAASAGVTFATIGSVNIVINYTIAPAAGTNNLNYSILIKK